MEWIQFNQYILADHFLQKVFKNNVKLGDRSCDLKAIKEWICENVESKTFYNLMDQLAELASEEKKQSPQYAVYLYQFSKEIYEIAKKVNPACHLQGMAESILYLVQIYYPIFNIILINRRDNVQKGFKKIKDWNTFSKEVLAKVEKVA